MFCRLPTCCGISQSRHCKASLLDRLHLDSDAVDGPPRGVEDPSGWLRRHVHDQTSLTLPSLDRLYDIPVRRQLCTVRSEIMHWSLNLVEDENRRPPMMVDGFFVVWLQSHLQHAQPLVLKEDFVMLWRCESTASNCGSQLDGSKSARLSVMVYLAIRLEVWFYPSA